MRNDKESAELEAVGRKLATECKGLYSQAAEIPDETWWRLFEIATDYLISLEQRFVVESDLGSITVNSHAAATARLTILLNQLTLHTVKITVRKLNEHEFRDASQFVDQQTMKN